MNRALPGPINDLIRDGVSPKDLRDGGGRAVWNALVRTAMSAWQRGWDREEWEALLLEPRSALGSQARTRDGVRERTPKATAKTLADAWDRAQQRVSEQPARSRGQIRQAAQDRARAALELVGNADADLADIDRAVLAHAAGLAHERGIDRLALPWRQVVAATGCGERAVKNALARLDSLGLLVCTERGRAAGPGSAKRRASLYRLAAPGVLYLYPDTGSVGPPSLLCGTPASTDLGTPRTALWDPPAATPTQPEPGGPDVVTFTVTASDPDQLAAALNAIIRRQGIEADVAPAADEAPRPANVTPMRDRRRPRQTA